MRVDDDGPGSASTTQIHQAFRWLIEVCCHEQPRGTTRLTLARLRRVIAFAAEAVQLRTMSDIHWKGLDEITVSIVNGALEARTSERYASATWQQAAGFPEGDLAAHAQNRRELSVAIAAAELEAVEAAFVDEYGYSREDLYATARDLALAVAVRGAPSFTATVDEGRLRSLVSRRRGLATSAAGTLVDHLMLRRNPRFDPLHFEFEAQRHTRSQSYVMRPLVKSTGPVVFGAFHLLCWQPFHEGLVLTARLPTAPGPVRSAMGALSQRLDQHFAETVAEGVGALQGWTARSNLWRLGPVSLRDAGLGDIDVLAVNPGSRMAVAIEAKRMAAGLTPYDVWQERQQFHDGRKRYVAKHWRRIEFLEDRRQLLDDEFGVVGAPWKVAGCIVTSAPLMGPALVDGALPVLTLPRLIPWLRERELTR